MDSRKLNKLDLAAVKQHQDENNLIQRFKQENEYRSDLKILDAQEISNDVTLDPHQLDSPEENS